jgi:hypothetical protein
MHTDLGYTRHYDGSLSWLTPHLQQRLHALQNIRVEADRMLLMEHIAGIRRSHDKGYN